MTERGSVSRSNVGTQTQATTFASPLFHTNHELSNANRDFDGPELR